MSNVQSKSGADRAPRWRRLRVFTFDPSLSQQLDTAALNETVLHVRWETDLQRGPVGEYFAVVDPEHPPVDLNDRFLIAQDGLAPAEGKAQFHQQMLYAVAMTTLDHFERALGRVVLWNPARLREGFGEPRPEAGTRWMPQLKLMPHALREANAYYSAADQAIQFGYFPATQLSDDAAAAETVFSCLSQDVVAHELTHFIVHGLLPYSIKDSNVDAFAFHEGVSDLVAILQQFAHPDALEDEIRRSEGELSLQNYLGKLALQFGRAMGRKKGLRDTLGAPPNLKDLREKLEPHERGAILVNAVLEAVQVIYRSQTTTLRRLAARATQNTARGDLHPDLVHRLAAAASDIAQDMLYLVIRALDYCPPVDINFGDYLRALVTADHEACPSDRNRRLALTEAFRRRGIFAEGIQGLSPEAIRWPESRAGELVPDRGYLEQFSECWNPNASRQQINTALDRLLYDYEDWLLAPGRMTRKLQRELGIALADRGTGQNQEADRFRVESLRPARRITEDGELKLDWVVHVVQEGRALPGDGADRFCGGCTLVIDADTGRARYTIAKHIRDKRRYQRTVAHLNFRTEGGASPQPRRPDPHVYAGPIDFAGLPAPTHRRLRTYAFDPTLGWQLDTAVLNQTTLRIKWEPLEPGPIGEYLEVIDFDPASRCFYPAVNLDETHHLAQDGLAPSEGTPQFHQQMVYAVAMNTIAHFEQALGRAVLWSPRIIRRTPGKPLRSEFVRRLRVYPHGLRQANAYYHPEKKSLLFGYFPASPVDKVRNLPGGMVFTCLSQDIIAHETTHAVLDGIHRRYLEATNRDVLAFHEAFADIVALFQHFSHPEVLHHQIARTRGDLARQNLLGELAQQFGAATGRYGALRSAIGSVNPQTKQWEPARPDPADLDRARDPHNRGAILVAAVFDAFLTIYKARIADLLRIATGGTGRLPEGELHPELVKLLAEEAGKTAKHVLQMGIRALDYCPPVDLTFGEFLRALITADFDLVPDDDRGYRIAIIEAFRRRGIHPEDVRTLSLDSLLWSNGDLNLRALDKSRSQELFKDIVNGWRLKEDRKTTYERMNRLGGVLNRLIHEAGLSDSEQRTLGIILGDKASKFVRCRNGRAMFEVHSLRRARRIAPDGTLKVDLVIELTQRHKRPYPGNEPQLPPFRGGCTLIVDPHTGEVRYCISKDIRSQARLERQRDFLDSPEALPLQAAYFGDPRRQGSDAALLALLHSGDEV